MPRRSNEEATTRPKRPSSLDSGDQADVDRPLRRKPAVPRRKKVGSSSARTTETVESSAAAAVTSAASKNSLVAEAPTSPPAELTTRSSPPLVETGDLHPVPPDSVQRHSEATVAPEEPESAPQPEPQATESDPEDLRGLIWPEPEPDEEDEEHPESMQDPAAEPHEAGQSGSERRLQSGQESATHLLQYSPQVPMNDTEVPTEPTESRRRATLNDCKGCRNTFCGMCSHVTSSP